MNGGRDTATSRIRIDAVATYPKTPRSLRSVSVPYRTILFTRLPNRVPDVSLVSQAFEARWSTLEIDCLSTAEVRQFPVATTR